jgi:plastocyanin
VLSVAASFAQTKHVIKVSNFQFAPANTNAAVGDLIVFIWVNGTHTTTSTTIPARAKPWDTAVDVNHTRFKYKIRVAGTYNFHCSIHPLSMVGKIIVSSPLDAALGTFALNWENAKAVLTWKTNPGTDVSYFSVQRSSDGSNFTEIAKLKAPSSHTYTYTDQASLTNKYVYYQVQLFDRNGNSQLSDIKMLTNPVQTSRLITSISPNPVSSPGHLMLQFNADKEGKMLVQLYNSSGELIKQTEMYAVKGVNNGHFHLGDLKSGSYYIVCTLGDVQEKYTIMYQ